MIRLGLITFISIVLIDLYTYRIIDLIMDTRNLLDQERDINSLIKNPDYVKAD